MTVLCYNDPNYNGWSPFLKINNWLQFFFFVKAAALKQQISKCCLQIQCTQKEEKLKPVYIL